MKTLFVVMSLAALAFGVWPVVTIQGDTIDLSWQEPHLSTTAQPGEVPFTVYYGPFLYRLSDTLVVVGWKTAAVTQQTFDNTVNKDSLIRNAPGSYLTAEAANLTPGTRYIYRLTCSGSGFAYQSPLYSLTTNVAPNERVTWNGNLAIIRWDECLADPLAPAGKPPFSLFTGPYVGELTSNSISIGWECAALAASSKVTIGANGIAIRTRAYADAFTVDSLKYFDLRHVRITGLLPNTSYRYVLVSDGPDWQFRSDTFQVTTYQETVTDSQPFRFAVLGDSRGVSPLTQLNFNHMSAWKPQMWQNNGDIISTGSGVGGAHLSSKFQWIGIINATRLLGAGALHAPTLGNWDVSADEAQLGIRQQIHDYFYPYSRASGNRVAPARPPYYYSYDAAGVHFVVLCSQIAGDGTRPMYDNWLGNEMVDWLEEDLKNSRAKWKIVNYHDPAFTLTKMGTKREAVGSILRRYGVQLVFKASAHTYTRTWRKSVSPSGLISRDDSGFIEIISGAAGHRALGYDDYGIPLYSNPAYGPDFEYAYRIVHHIRVSVFPKAIELVVVDSGLNIVESYRLPEIGQVEPIVPPRLSTENFMSALEENAILIHPNPFNPVVGVSYKLKSVQPVDLRVYDINGRLVFDRSGVHQEGFHQARFNFTDRAQGVYLLHFRAEGMLVTRKLTLNR